MLHIHIVSIDKLNIIETRVVLFIIIAVYKT